MHVSTRPKRRRTGNRPRRAVTVVLLASALGLAGCGSSDDADAAADDAAESAGGAADGYPLTVGTSQGHVTIEEAPQKVVALTVATADELLSLGVTPHRVAVSQEELESGYPWLVDDVTDIADPNLLTADYELNVEAIAATEPDLIVAQPYQVADTAVYDQLSDIAPTITPESGDVNVDWDVRLLKTAEAIGETEQAEAMIAGIEEDFAAIGANVPDIGTKTYQWVRADPDGWGFGNGSVLELFGMQPAANQDNTQNSAAPLAMDNTSDLNADLLAVWAPTPELRAGLDDNPAFQALPSVVNGTVIYAELDFANAANSPAPMSLAWLKDKVTPHIEALAG